MRRLPSSIFTGKRTVNSRRTSRSTARSPWERPSSSAASSNWRCALCQGLSTGGLIAAALPNPQRTIARMLLTPGDGAVADTPSIEQVRGWTPPRGLLRLRATCPDAPDIAFLRDAFQLHPLVIEDLEHRNQRPKMDDFPTMLFVVLFGTVSVGGGEVKLAEVHIMLGDGWLATVSDVEVPALRQLW